MGKKDKTSTNDFLEILEDSEEASSDSSFLWRSKTRDKVETNRGQSGDKLVGKVETNRGQSRDKVETKKPQKIKTRDKVETQPRTQPETKWRQTEDKVETNPDFSALIGLQRKLLIIIYKSCLKNQDGQSQHLSLEFLCHEAKSPSSSVKKTIQRLEKKGFIIRKAFKNGRGGWTVYSIPKLVFQDLLHNETRDKVETNRGQTRDKVESQLETQPRTSLHSSSEIKNLKSTTTIDNVDNFILKHNILIPEELNKVGFREGHLKQILQVTSLSCEEIEESLNHYALDLRNGSVRAGFGKLNLIIGVLKKSNQYVSEAYIAEEQKMLEELAKRADKLIELKKKQSEIKLLKKYKTWKANLNQDEINKLVPPSNIIVEGGTLQDIQLQSYYEGKYANDN